MSEKLKPCPFCGGEAVVDKYHVRGYEPAISFEVRCSLCKQKRTGGYFDTVYKSEEWARKKAIEAWNTRPNPWHTGTPTEEGDYLVKLDVEHHVYPYYVFKWNKGGWYSHYDMDYPACPQHRVLKWQKIEGVEDGLTD